ncbi:MAG TPA: RodZ domain-containing protein [Actinomycetota bacterium]
MSPTAPIGSKLRNARIERVLSIEEAAWRTRIRPDVLRALEDGEFETLDEQTFVRGHLTSYARFLGMDAANLVQELNEVEGPPPSQIGELDKQRKREKKPPRAKWLVAALASLTILVGAGVAGIIGGQAERPPGDPALEVPAVAAPVEDGRVPVAEAKVRLRVQVAETTLVSVIADGEELFEGELAAGTERSFRARDEIRILVASGGVARLTLNGEDVGIAGEKGSVYEGRFGPDGPLD